MVIGGHTVDGNCSKYVLLNNASLRHNEMMFMALVVATETKNYLDTQSLNLSSWAKNMGKKLFAQRNWLKNLVPGRNITL